MNASFHNRESSRTVRRWSADHDTAKRPLPAQDAYDVVCGLAIADMYEAMTHGPRDPLVRASYKQLIAELRQQFEEHVVNIGGIAVEPWFGSDGEPYRNSREVVADVIYFGHARFGYRVGSLGQENAWRAHLRLLSLLAIPAFTTETRGQSSWFNGGRHLRTADGRVPTRGEPGDIPLSDRPFPEQKNALLPSEVSGVRLYQDPDTGVVVAEALPDWHPTGSGLGLRAA